jgi:hypothetical protein
MIQLKRAKEADIPLIQEIAKITWQPTYVPLLGQEQVDYMLDKMYNKGVLLGQLEEGHIFLIAELGMKHVGFAAYSILDLINSIRSMSYRMHMERVWGNS